MPLPATRAPDVDSVTFAEEVGAAGEVESAVGEPAGCEAGRGGGWAASPGAANVAWAAGAGKAVAGVPDSAVAAVPGPAALPVGIAVAGAAAALPVAWPVPVCCAVTLFTGVAAALSVEGGIGPRAF